MFFEKSEDVKDAEAFIERMKEQRLTSGTLSLEQSHSFSTHVEGAAYVARTIALHIPEMRDDPKLIDQVYISALLHDIGRLDEKQKKCFHGFLGFEILNGKVDEISKEISEAKKTNNKTNEEILKLESKAKKYSCAARAALIHMFPDNQIPPFESCKLMFFDKRKDYDTMARILKPVELRETDRLIQLADCLANGHGLVCLSERFREYQERRKIKLTEEEISSRWRLKRHFDEKIGGDVYELFPSLQEYIALEKGMDCYYNVITHSGVNVPASLLSPREIT